jgi:hypothetical protein
MAAAYNQIAKLISSMPLSMMLAMRGDWVSDTDAPWCKVFHHLTEK